MSIPNIKLTNNTSYFIDRKIFAELVELLCELEESLREKEISICLVGNEEISDLNRRFFGRDSVTDVLTFNNEFPSVPYLGEVVINIELIMEEAEPNRQRVLTKILIHGILHLMNFDHINSEEKRVMLAKEEAILQKIYARKEG